MIRSCLKMALRHLVRDRGHAALNIAGLSVGIAACLVISLYVTHELSYDRHYRQAENIYRVNMEWQFRDTGVITHQATVSPVFAKRIQEDTPGIAETGRL